MNTKKNHKLNSSLSPVLTATSLSYGKAKNSTLHKTKTPDPTETKFDTVDYVRETTPSPKSLCWGFSANKRNISKTVIYIC